MIMLRKGDPGNMEEVVASGLCSMEEYLQSIYPSKNPANNGKMAYLSRISAECWSLTHPSFPEIAFGRLAELTEWWAEACPVPEPDEAMRMLAENIRNPPPEAPGRTTNLTAAQRLEIEDLLKDI